MKTQVVNEPDIWDAMLKIREQLMALDRKLDLVLMLASKQSSTQSSTQPRPQPSVQPFAAKPANQGRPVFRATCADCQKECELPFKPSGDRPVYCKECFAKRRAGNNFKTAFVNRPPQGQTPVAVAPSAAVVPAPVNVSKKKLSAAKKSPTKKPAAKKKPVTKKKRK